MRKKVMAFNARVEAWIMQRLKGVWLDPVFLVLFLIMTAVSIAGAIRLQRKGLYYSAILWGVAALMCLRRIREIKKHEQEENDSQNTEEK